MTPEEQIAQLEKKVVELTQTLETIQGYVRRKTGQGDRITGVFQLKSFTVANLPSVNVIAGSLAYASNGRKNGQGAGLGTGVVVFRDGTAWRACDTGATVAA